MQAQGDNRSQGRSNVFLAASLVCGAGQLPVRIRNLSQAGALLDGGSLPPAGSKARLVRGRLSADGEIAWVAQGQAGMRFTGEIDVAAWVARVGHPGQQRVDAAIAAHRRDEPFPASVQAGEPSSLAAISEELNAICNRLAASPSIVAELGEELVKLDALASALQQLAGRAT